MDDEKFEEYLRNYPYKHKRRPYSPRVNQFDEHVMRRCEYFRKKKKMAMADVLPYSGHWYYLLLKQGKRKIYNTQLFLLAEGLDVSIDDLVKDLDVNTIELYNARRR